MKLIDEKEVEKKAFNYSIDANTDRLQEIDDNCCYDFEEYISEAVKEGVEFAEKKLLPITFEFTEWVGNMAFYFDKITERWIELGNTNKFTTDQLLEQFIKNKQNEKA